MVDAKAACMATKPASRPMSFTMPTPLEQPPFQISETVKVMGLFALSTFSTFSCFTSFHRISVVNSLLPPIHFLARLGFPADLQDESFQSDA